jgi:hypothetical protein
LALDYIAENPEGEIQEVINLLGNTKKGRSFTKNQADFALKRASGVLFSRVEASLATEQEQGIKTKIENTVMRQSWDAHNQIKEVIGNFFKTERKSVSEIIQTPPIQEPPNPDNHRKIELSTSIKPRKSAIERRFPDCREKINSILDKIESQSKSVDNSKIYDNEEFGGFTVPQLALFFQIIAEDTKKAQQVRSVSPTSKDGHPIFGIKDTVFLIFKKELLGKNNLNKNQLNPLLKIIVEEIEKRKQKKS